MSHYLITFDLPAPAGVAAIARAISGNLATSANRPSQCGMGGASGAQHWVGIRRTRVHTPEAGAGSPQQTHESDARKNEFGGQR